jgi:succinyl-diaminopimelate desuccinylase
MTRDTTENLLKIIEARREEMIELAQSLIRFPTINPPGEAYQPCAEFIGGRLRARGFAVEYVRAAGTPGDSERHPRITEGSRRCGSQAPPQAESQD